MKKKQFFKVLGSIALVATSLLSGCSQTRPIINALKAYDSESQHSTVNRMVRRPVKKPINTAGISSSEYTTLANLNFKSGGRSYYYVNHDQSSLNPKNWRTNHVVYQNLDKLNRTSSSNVGYLEHRNLANDSLRVRQYIEPSGWHFNKGKQIYNRGHLIAYSLSAGINQQGKYFPKDQSGDQNNPKNLFTQSAYTNQKIQTIYEAKVRQALQQNKKVIFSATPIFRGTERMARGINLQAVSTDGKLNFNVYIFNVEPGYRFNYQNGRARVDHNFKVDGLNGYDSSWNKGYNSRSRQYLLKGRFYWQRKCLKDYQQRQHYLQRFNESKRGR